jgi:hypothetical protein
VIAFQEDLFWIYAVFFCHWEIEENHQQEVRVVHLGDPNLQM